MNVLLVFSPLSEFIEDNYVSRFSYINIMFYGTTPLWIDQGFVRLLSRLELGHKLE